MRIFSWSGSIFSWSGNILLYIEMSNIKVCEYLVCPVVFLVGPVIFGYIFSWSGSKYCVMNIVNDGEYIFYVSGDV